MKNIIESYLEFTEDLLVARRSFGSLYQFSAVEDERLIPVMEEIYNQVFHFKKLYKGEKEQPFGTWLIEGVFPLSLYRTNGESLAGLLEDNRTFSLPVFNKRGSTHSFFGRMSRPRGIPNSSYSGFLDYTIDRWKRGSHKSMPHFYFSVEDPTWVFEELMRNKNQIKSGRTAVACVMNISFRWDPISESPVVSLILKHTQWHHTFGDFCGASWMIRSLAKEVGLDPAKSVVNIFFPSASLDHPKEAKAVVKKMQDYLSRVNAPPVRVKGR